MAVRTILKLGDPTLLARSQPVDTPYPPDIVDLIRDMKDTLAAANGAGLAAPQIGVLKRVILISAPAKRISENHAESPLPVTVLINPSLEPVAPEPNTPALENGWEGCLSIPDLIGVVPRHQTVHYQALNEQGQPVSGQATGFHARVLQHECDHLDGILYPMRMTDLKWLSFTDQADKGLIETVTARKDSAGVIT